MGRTKPFSYRTASAAKSFPELCAEILAAVGEQAWRDRTVDAPEIATASMAGRPGRRRQCAADRAEMLAATARASSALARSRTATVAENLWKICVNPVDTLRIDTLKDSHFCDETLP